MSIEFDGLGFLLAFNGAAEKKAFDISSSKTALLVLCDRVSFALLIFLDSAKITGKKCYLHSCTVLIGLSQRNRYRDLFSLRTKWPFVIETNLNSRQVKVPCSYLSR